jgi:hypothetical protein
MIEKCDQNGGSYEHIQNTEKQSLGRPRMIGKDNNKTNLLEIVSS